MVRIHINDGIHPDGQTLLEEAGYEINIEKLTQEQLFEALPSFDVLILRSSTKVRKELIDRCPDLKLIARGGVGLDNIDVEYARSKGITVFDTPNPTAASVAELVFGHIFSLARFLHHTNREMPLKGSTDFLNLKEKYSNGLQLRGKKLGIIGFGRVGQQVARIGMGVGMEIMPVDLVVNEVDIDVSLYNSDQVSLTVKFTTGSLIEMLPEADFVTLHVPFNGGEPIIGADEINQMKTGAFLINTSRGGTIDEKALLAALDSGKLAGAALDVYNEEPSPQEKLLQHPKVSLTPHTGAATAEAQRGNSLAVADKIIAFYGDDK